MRYFDVSVNELSAAYGLRSLECRRRVADISFLYRLINCQIYCFSLLEMIRFRIPTGTRQQHLFELSHAARNYFRHSPIPRLKRLGNDICSLPHVTGSINVLGDSHVKELSAKLRPVLADNWNIFACASSGAPLSHVLQNCYDMTKQSGKNDIVVIIGGSNDVVDVTYNNRRPARVLAGQILRATRQYEHTNVVIVGLFHRHDLPENCLINTEIKLTNKKLNGLKDLRGNGVSVLDVNKIGRQLFTRHGQHLNGAGKTALCKLIARAVENIEKRHLRGSTSERF
ncbi:hypothetical protein J6590_023961 [Homalodisca vitripennis]|nr:hypothetical protein J6590_023961 [Homalodisca vitripennis]